jgi:hypothetical protein
MRALGLCAFAVMALPLVASCGETVTDACDDYATAWCSRQYSCFQGTALANLMTEFGPTPQACAVNYANELNLNCVSAESTCVAGTSYDTGAAETCVTAYQALSCTDITQQVTPAQCAIDLICH